MTFKQFLDTYNGQSGVGNTNENKGQCVGLVAVYIDSLTLPHIWGDAKDLFANADEKFFDKVLNTLEAIPQQGDIIVWSSAFNGTVGHTGIATGTADLKTFEVFEQNDPLGSNSHLKTYPNYKFVIGWLKPKITNQQAELDKCRVDRDNHWNELSASKETIANLNTQIQTTQQALTLEHNDNSNLKAQLTNEQDAKDVLQEQVNQFQSIQAEFNQVKTDYASDKIKWNTQFTKDNQTIAQLENSSYKTLPTGELIKIVLARIFRIK